MGIPRRKPLYFMASSLKDLREMPEPVQDVFGSALLDAQYGDHPDGARPFGEGVPRGVMKLVEDFDRDTYRAAYTVKEVRHRSGDAEAGQGHHSSATQSLGRALSEDV